MASYFKSRGQLRPHPYQRSALASLLWGLRRCRFRSLALDYRWPGEEPGRSQICVLPTGTGKTIVFGFLAGFLAARRRPRRVLILAHRDTLIRQAAEKLGFLGIPLAIEKAERKARHHLALSPETRVVVASVQTMKGRRLCSWDQDYFDLIIVDEAHHATARGHRAIFDWFARAKVVGVTATDRSDGVGLGRVFDRKAYEMTLPAAIDQGWLCPILGVRSDVPVDLKGLRTRGGDFNDAQLDERITQVIEPIALAVRREVGARKTILFAPTVKTARAFADALCQLGVSAKATHGEDPTQSKVLDQFKAGEFQVLCNCALLTEGYDEPAISAVVIARPTKSSTLLMQMIGRGTRLHKDSGKKDCLIIDFGWECDRDKIKTVLDLFIDDKAHADDVALAKSFLEATPPGEAVDPQELLEKAKQAREAKEAKRERDRARVKVKDRELNYRRVTFDPVGVRSIVGGVAPPSHEGVVAMPASAASAAKLKDLGYDSTVGMGQREADAMIARLEQRAACGMSTLPQIKLLTKFGLDPARVHEMTKAEASAAIAPLMQRKSGRRSG